MTRTLEFADGTQIEFKVITNWRKQGELGRNICIKGGCKHCNGDLYIIPNKSSFCSTSPTFISDSLTKIIQETP